MRVPVRRGAPMPLSERKIIARRARSSSSANSVVNLGIGMPEGVAHVATEEKLHRPPHADRRARRDRRRTRGRARLRRGGQRAGRSSTSPTSSTSTMAAASTLAFLGLAQADRARQPQRQQVRAAAGRRRRLHQHQRRTPRSVVFVGTFTAGALQVEVGGRAARDRREGQVAASSSSRSSTGHLQRAATPAERGQPVLYITERCVFHAHARRPRAHRGRARHRRRARHSGAHGFQAADTREPRSWTSASSEVARTCASGTDFADRFRCERPCSSSLRFRCAQPRSTLAARRRVARLAAGPPRLYFSSCRLAIFAWSAAAPFLSRVALPVRFLRSLAALGAASRRFSRGARPWRPSAPASRARHEQAQP